MCTGTVSVGDATCMPHFAPLTFMLAFLWVHLTFHYFLCASCFPKLILEKISISFYMHTTLFVNQILSHAMSILLLRVGATHPNIKSLIKNLMIPKSVMGDTNQRPTELIMIYTRKNM